MNFEHHAGTFTVLLSIFCLMWPVPCLTETRPETSMDIDKNIIDSIEIEIDKRVSMAFEKSMEEMHTLYHHRISTLEKEVLHLMKTNNRLENNVSQLRKEVRSCWTKELSTINGNHKAPTFTDNLKNIIKVTGDKSNANVSNENFGKRRHHLREDDPGIMGEKIHENNQIQHERNMATRFHKSDIFSTSTQNVSQRINKDIRQTEKANNQRYRASGILGNQGKVAFTAFMTVDIHDVARAMTLKFDGVTTNIGSGYNHFTGAFVCPVAGTYVFYHSLEVSKDLFFTQLMKNGVLIGHNIAASDHSNDVGSGFTIVNLNQGDTVWIQVDTFTPGITIFTFGSTFSGFLLYPN